MRSLREWQRTRTEQMGESDARLKDWQQLQRVLGEQTLDDLKADVSRLRSEAESRAAVADSSELTAALAQPLDDAELAELKKQTSAALRAETLSRLHMREAQDTRFEEAMLRRGEAATELREVALAIGSEAADLRRAGICAQRLA